MSRISLYLAIATLALSFTASGEEKTDAYSNLFKDKETITEKGLMTLHKVEEKIYLEIPQELLGKHFISGSIVETSNDFHEAPAGYCPAKPIHFFFEKADSSLLMRSFKYGKHYSKDKNIEQALEESHIPAIISTYDIKAYTPDSTAVVIDASDFFLNSGEFYNPLDPQAYNSMDGYVKRKGSYLSSNSFIESISAFEDNISVTSTVTYKVKSALLGIFAAEQETYLTASIRRSILLLPDEKMNPRPADKRIGSGTVRVQEFSDKQSGMKTNTYATRWNIEKRPVTFYIDDAFPESWIPAIKRSLDLWNETFAEVGRRQAIRYCMYSEAGEAFSPADIMNSCIRYIPSPSQKITDSRWTDPTTGEILRADICINQGIIEKIQKNLFLYTGAADPSVRKIAIDEQIFTKALSSLLMRNIGHCLGLEDNFAGSRAFPVDSLNNADFTRRNGISGSVMDELPFNFIADVEAVKNGASMMQIEPGAYDRFAINYLYSPLPQDVIVPDFLREMVDARQDEPEYHYGKKQNKKAFFDPRAMVLDLGDNSKEAARRGFEGLAEIVEGASEWLDLEDPDYSYRVMLYDELVNLTYEYVKQVFVNVGGIYVNERTEGADRPLYSSVPKEQQKEFLIWIMKEISDFSWLDNSRLAKDVGLLGSIGDFCQKYYSRFIFSQIGEMYVSESKSSDPYTQVEAMKDVAEFVWKDAASGAAVADITKFQQELFIDYLSTWSESDSNSSGSSSIRYKSTPVRSHIWYGMLEKTRVTVVKAIRRAKDEKTANHYRFLLWKLDKALK